MATNDLDPHLIKCIGLLYESKKLRKGDVVPLQYMLEEAIYQKSGITKDYTDLFQAFLPPREDDSDCQIIEEKGSNSDNDLELDLLQEDLMCVVCKKMDVGVRNRLLECNDCHALYHQECHRPVVLDEELVENWTCSNCKSISMSSSKKLKISESTTPSSSSSSKDHGSFSKSSSSSSKSSSHKHGSSSSSHKSSSSSDKHKSSSSSSRKSSPSGHSSSSLEKKSSSSSSSKSKSSSKHREKRKHD